MFENKTAVIVIKVCGKKKEIQYANEKNLENLLKRNPEIKLIKRVTSI